MKTLTRNSLVAAGVLLCTLVLMTSSVVVAEDGRCAMRQSELTASMKNWVDSAMELLDGLQEQPTENADYLKLSIEEMRFLLDAVLANNGTERDRLNGEAERVAKAMSELDLQDPNKADADQWAKVMIKRKELRPEIDNYFDGCPVPYLRGE